MLAMHTNHARLSKFRSATPTILYGNLLAEVKTLQKSILRQGLIKPLIVARDQQRLVVIDGRKRLMALRRLRFNGLLPARLTRIPYVILDEHRRKATDVNILKSEPEKAYTHIKEKQSAGMSVSEIAIGAGLTKDTVRALLTLDHLSTRLRSAFLSREITLKQALAFATLENMDAQDELYSQLGDLAADDATLRAIVDGATVLPLQNGDFIILPSRHTHKEHMRLAA